MGVVREEFEGLEVMEDGGERIDGFQPGVGGPEAVVFLVDGGDWAVSGIAGGFGMGFVMRVGLGIDAGLWWGLEEEDEE